MFWTLILLFLDLCRTQVVYLFNTLLIRCILVVTCCILLHISGTYTFLKLLGHFVYTSWISVMEDQTHQHHSEKSKTIAQVRQTHMLYKNTKLQNKQKVFSVGSGRAAAPPRRLLSLGIAKEAVMDRETVAMSSRPCKVVLLYCVPLYSGSLYRGTPYTGDSYIGRSLYWHYPT